MSTEDQGIQEEILDLEITQVNKTKDNKLEPVIYEESTKPDKYSTYKPEMEEAMVEIVRTFKCQLSKEDDERKEIISYLKIFLPLVIMVPLILIAILIAINAIEGTVVEVGSILIAIAAIPIEIMGVFKVISEKLFADTYRTSLPELLGKYKEFTQDK